jgi:hypothetical protein
MDLRAAALADGICWLKHPTQSEIIGNFQSRAFVPFLDCSCFHGARSGLAQRATMLYKKLSQLRIVTMSL